MATTAIGRPIMPESEAINARARGWRRIKNREDRMSALDLARPMDRARAYGDLTFIDHGFLRIAWTHLYEIAPGAWRSNQPGPGRIAKHAQNGFKSVLRLRAPRLNGRHLLEREACVLHGLKLVNVQINAGSLGPAERLIELLDAFASIEKPFVMHCKSGIDRTGLAAFLYLLAETDTAPKIARQQLSFKYLHLNNKRHGILDHMADAYLTAYDASGVGLRDWLTREYDREALTESYRAQTLGAA